MENTANLTTTMKNDFTKNIDSSKFDFILNIRADRSNKKSLLDAKITYSSNDLFSLKFLNTNETIGISSEDILDKYIASSKNKLDDSINKATGIKTDISADTLEDKLNSISTNRIEMDDEYKSSKVKEYTEEIDNLIPESAVTLKENVVVTMDSEAINTDAYTLNLENSQYKEILKTVLEKFKNDDELLNKICTGAKNTIQNIQMQTGIVEDEINEYEAELETKSVSEIDLVMAFVLGKKIDGTVEDLKEKIKEELSNTNSNKDGIIITIYVRSEEGKSRETVKLVADFPRKTNLDVEYIGETKFKVTYLEPKEDEAGKEIITGSSIEIERQTTDVNVKYNLQYSSIENKKVISKIQMELQTNNANASKGYTNNAIIKYNNNEGDLKVNIKNEIKFQEETIDEELTDENAIFLDVLSDEEAKNLYTEIFQKVMSVYAEKLVNLTFIDNNSLNSIIQQPVVQPVNSAEKQEIRNKLIETVSMMMGDAQQNGEEFTIQNLANLSIEGYDVSSIVSADLAIIKINGYTFNIDKDFMLSE